MYLSRLTGDLRRGMGLTAITDPGYHMPATPEGFVVDDPEDPAIDYPLGGPEEVRATDLGAVVPDD